MTTTTATARLTVGSIFGAVNNAATSVASIFDTATKAIDMGNKYVSDASDKQRIRSTIDMHDFKEVLVEQKSMEETLRKKTILDFTNQSPENAELFKSAYDRLTLLINPTE